MPAPEILVSSLFSWRDSDGLDQTLDVDVVMAAVDQRTAKLTDHVVEDGAVITDHVIIEPERLSLELTVTQTPITGSDMVSAPTALNAQVQKLNQVKIPLDVRPSQFVPGGFLFLTSGVRRAITGILTGVAGGAPVAQGSEVEMRGFSRTANVLQRIAGATDRVADVHDKLVEILSNALLVTISFKGVLYVDYLLTEVTLTQAAGHGKFKVEARAFRTVVGTAVALPDPADFRVKAKTKKGAKNGTTPDPDPTKANEQMVSISERNGVGDAIGLKKEANSNMGFRNEGNI